MSESQKSKKQIHQDKIYHESKKYSKYCILLLNDKLGLNTTKAKQFKIYICYF